MISIKFFFKSRLEYDNNKNPTKWYITIPSLRIADIKSKPIWLGPFSHISLHVKNEINEKESVTFDVIDDVGAIHRRKSVIN